MEGGIDSYMQAAIRLTEQELQELETNKETTGQIWEMSSGLDKLLTVFIKDILHMRAEPVFFPGGWNALRYEIDINEKALEVIKNKQFIGADFPNASDGVPYFRKVFMSRWDVI